MPGSMCPSGEGKGVKARGCGAKVSGAAGERVKGCWRVVSLDYGESLKKSLFKEFLSLFKAFFKGGPILGMKRGN